MNDMEQQVPETPADGYNDATDQATGAYKICVVPNPDGTFNVYKEALGGGPAMGGEAQGETLESLELALKMVIKIVQDNPPGGDAQKQFGAGFQESNPQGERY